jgi:hypothetical protein
MEEGWRGPRWASRQGTPDQQKPEKYKAICHPSAVPQAVPCGVSEPVEPKKVPNAEPWGAHLLPKGGPGLLHPHESAPLMGRHWTHSCFQKPAECRGALAKRSA